MAQMQTTLKEVEGRLSAIGTNVPEPVIDISSRKTGSQVRNLILYKSNERTGVIQ